MSQATEQIARQYANGADNKKVWGDVLFNAKLYGAIGDGSADDTNAIQQAILDANAAGGGTVYLPRGRYKITSLYLHINVRLVGESYLSNNVFAGIDDHRGSWLFCYGTALPAVTMASCTKIENIGFFYPTQSVNAAPTAFPPSIKTEESHVKFTIAEVVLQNSYIGIECTTAHENLTVERVQGLPLYQGIVVDQGTDIDRIADVNFAYNSYPGAGEVLRKWIADNGTAFTIRKTDWGFLTGSNCFGYKTGLLVENSSILGIPQNLNISRLGIDGCERPIIIQGGKGIKLHQINLTQYNFFDLTKEFEAITLSDTDSVIIDDVQIGPTYYHGISLTNCNKTKIGNVTTTELGRSTGSGNPRFGLYLNGGNTNIIVKDSFIDMNNNPNTYGVFISGTNTQVNINDNSIQKVVSAMFFNAGSSKIIVKNNQLNGGSITDNLGAVTKDISSNMS